MKSCSLASLARCGLYIGPGTLQIYQEKTLLSANLRWTARSPTSRCKAELWSLELNRLYLYSLDAPPQSLIHFLLDHVSMWYLETWTVLLTMGTSLVHSWISHHKKPSIQRDISDQEAEGPPFPALLRTQDDSNINGDHDKVAPAVRRITTIMDSSWSRSYYYLSSAALLSCQRTDQTRLRWGSCRKPQERLKSR